MSLLSFQHYYRVGQAAKIQIDEINNLKDDKLFVNVCGVLKEEVISLTNKFIDLPIIKESAITKKKSFVCLEEISDLNLTQNRFKKAKENGFTTVLVFINTTKQLHEKSTNSFDELIKDNNLIDFYVNLKK